MYTTVRLRFYASIDKHYGNGGTLRTKESLKSTGGLLARIPTKAPLKERICNIVAQENAKLRVVKV